MTDIPPGWIALALGVIGLFGTGGFLAQRGKNRIDLLDQYQEDRIEDRKEVTQLRGDLDELNQRIQKMRRREIAMLRHLSDLHQHINAGHPPPPPPLPEELMNDGT